MKNLLIVLTLIGATTASAQDAKPKQAKKKPRVKRRVIDVSKIDLPKLAKTAKADPDGKGTISKFYIGYVRKVISLYVKEPKKAKALLKQMAADIKEIKPTTESAKAALKRAKLYHARYTRRVVMMENQAAMIGRPAIPLKSQAWANGKSLSDSDLKGKVVLIDFWAVWCGPCVRKFPVVRRWHRQLADKGLVIIGVTRRYNYRWDKEAGKHKRVSKDDETVPVDEETEMLNHYAKKHKLNYRLMIADEETTLHKKYHVFGIPTVAVVDRKGVIRYVGLSNDKKVESLLKQLLDDSKATAGSE